MAEGYGHACATATDPARQHLSEVERSLGELDRPGLTFTMGVREPEVTWRVVEPN